MKLGVIGLSPGNGHPISFSAIINGYDPEGLSNCGWPVIDSYVKKRNPDEFGFSGVKVTHVWSQETEISEKISRAAKIPNIVTNLESMIPAVDGVLIARDDYESHVSMALPFLKAGKKVFIDKPLTLNIEELRQFRPFLESAQLMSCSGMRYAPEILQIKKNPSPLGDIILVRGSVLNNWGKYGIHLLEAIAAALPKFEPISILSLSPNSDSYSIENTDGTRIQIDALGSVPKLFRVDFFGTRGFQQIDLLDNFTMFRGMLAAFIETAKTGKPDIEPKETLRIIRTLIAGELSKKTQKRFFLDELPA